MVNSNVIVCAIILYFSLCKFTSVSGFTPRRTSLEHVNNTHYETSERKPVTPETDDETSQEEDDDEDDAEDSGGGGGDGGGISSSSSESNEFEEDKNCTCSGSSCLCCINLNLSFIDLGGPGCVKFSYIPDNDTMAVNMSYGERLLESSMLKRESLEQTCMDLFSDLAQMCAKFSDLTRVTNGVKGCLTVEPLLLGVSQTNYDVGCFNMDVQGLQPQTTPTLSFQYGTKGNSTKETSTGKPDENEEEELAAAISQSAEEGIAWFNNFISTVFGEESNETTSAESIEQSHNKTQTVTLSS